MNGVHCQHCDTDVISTHLHVFRWCACPVDSGTRVAVDGGNDYLWRCYDPGATFTELP